MFPDDEDPTAPLTRLLGEAGFAPGPYGVWHGESGDLGAVPTAAGLFIGWVDVHWDGPATPVPFLRAVAHLPADDAQHRLQAMLEIARRCREKELRTCSTCGEPHVPGHMHDRTTCQGCASAHLGVVY